MTWEREVAFVDTPEDRAGRARALLDAALAADEPAPLVRELMESGDLAGILDHPRQLEELRARKGLSGLVGRLERRARAAAREVDLRVAGEDDEVDLREVSGAPSDWPSYEVPRGYVVSPTGAISRLDRQGRGVSQALVAHEPIFPVSSRVDVLSGREWLVLGFRHGRDRSWRTASIPRELAKDARGVAALAGHGAPVSSATSRDLVRWLDACEATAGSRVTTTRATSRLGWHGDTYVAGPSAEIELEDDAAFQGWREHGTWEGWLEVTRLLSAAPVAMLVLYASAMAPMLRFLELGFCPIVDVSGRSGTGKTTVLKLAASGWGAPSLEQGAIALTWDATHVGLEETAARCWDVPLIIDDSKRSTSTNADREKASQKVADALYQLHQGRGKQRGKASGGLRATPSWRSVVLSTGERPAVDHTEAGGARNRVLSVTEQAIPDRATGLAVEAILREHHGHLGARVAAAALEHGEEIRTRHLEALAGWGELVAADTRLLSAAAAIDVAAWLLHEVVGVPRPFIDPCAEGGLLEQVVKRSALEADQAGRALELVREHMARNPHLFCKKAEEHETRAPTGGWHGLWRDRWIGMYPEALKRLLEDAGHDLAPIVERWADTGVLVTTPGRRVLEVGLGAAWGTDRKVRLYAFERTAVL